MNNPTDINKDKFIIPAEDIVTKVVEDDNWKNLHSKSWCPVPFNTISWHPSGVVSRCMMSDDDMGESHDSKEMQSLRQNMLDGKWDTYGCTNCLNREKNGQKSQRMNWLGKSMMDQLGNPEPYRTPQLKGNKISHLFVNFSNVCNFKCRMCSPNYSNSLIPEAKHMNSKFPREYKKFQWANPKNFNSIIPYLENNPKVLKGIRSIWMTGGEPFMDDSPYRLMELIEEFGHPEKIKMVITTNGSKLDVSRLGAFEKLKKLTLDISIDAAGPMFEYMRSNRVFTWSQMEEQCGKLSKFSQENKWFGIQINASYQIFNYDNTLDFLDFVYDHKADSNLRLVVFPKHLRAGNLPDSYKKDAHNIINKAELRYHNKDVHNIRTLNDMRRALDTKEHHLTVFQELVREQDKFREIYLHEYHEVLAEIIYGPKQPCLF
jgi:MoaA/NifB/PqqE/SkfB family radical SAM enzyme